MGAERSAVARTSTVSHALGQAGSPGAGSIVRLDKRYERTVKVARIAVIGTGFIGGTLGRKWSSGGHDVTFGARQPAKPEVMSLAHESGVAVVPVEEAARSAEVVVFAVPGGAMAETVASLAPLLEGRVVIDAANNVGDGAPNSAEAFAKHAPGAQYYRAFNSLGWELLDRPMVGGDLADMFFCGPDGEGKQLVERLVTDIGLRPVWLGGPEEVGTVDGAARLWLTLVFKRGHSRRLAFKILED